MTTLTKLTQEAKETCKQRGHKMGPFQRFTESRNSAICRACGMHVVANIRPAPSEIDISGEAVALDCPAKETQHENR
ncbi:hypothetical protein LCGC14_1902370 [marine sediment metagenome]|uniref:Uncharacterized protein n=1 Tax=marine sediment metagenome TaxID=412755 RepID=A0A0F9IA23_9ZZZZ